MRVRGRGRALLQRAREVHNPAGAWELVCWAAEHGLWAPVLQAINKRRSAWWFLRSRIRTTLAAWLRRPSPPAPGLRAHGSADDGHVPDFDLRTYNPIHWRPTAGEEAVALGRLDLLPPGTKADRAVRRHDPIRLRGHHHVVDAEGFHRDPASRAATLARLAAAGVVIHVADADDRLEALLGPELCKLTTIDPRGFDAGKRELHSIKMRREAMRTHSSWARGSKQPPTVSILLATRRPALLSHALAAVASQSYPRIELTLALHGPPDAFAGAEERAAALPLPATVMRAPSEAPIGTVLNEATEAASGTLLTKMDDDDLYGPEHVWDLVLAREYSGAQVVAKGFDFAYLLASDRTVRRGGGTGERYCTHLLAGGTLMIAAEDLARVGGWTTRRLDEDLQLVRGVLQAGGGVYRAHGAGFMLVRHGVDHSWRESDAHFLLNADSVVPGCASAAAEIDPISRRRLGLLAAVRPPARPPPPLDPVSRQRSSLLS